VVCNLTVDCLLDTFSRGIVDCGNSVLYLTNRDHQYTIPVTQGTRQQVPSASHITDASTSH